MKTAAYTGNRAYSNCAYSTGLEVMAGSPAPLDYTAYGRHFADEEIIDIPFCVTYFGLRAAARFGRWRSCDSVCSTR